MKTTSKVLLANGIITLVTTIFFCLATGEYRSFVMILGIIGFIVGVLNLLISPFIFLSDNKVLGKAFLLSGALYLVIGFAVCSSGFL